MSKIALLLPTYRGDNPGFLNEALTSVSRMTNVQFDVFVLIDGPIPDSLRQMITPFEKQGFRVIQYETNRRLPATLNSGVAMCLEQGYDFIARMDSDDLCFPQRLEQQVQFLVSHPEYDLAGTSAILIDGSNSVIGQKTVPAEVTFRDLLKSTGVIHPSVLFRSRFFERFGFYDETVPPSEDLDLWLRSTSAGARIANIGEPLLYFRYDAGLIQRRKKEQRINMVIKRRYTSGLRYWSSIIPHLVLLLVPAAVISLFLEIQKAQFLRKNTIPGPAST